VLLKGISARPARIEGKVLADNRLAAKTPAAQTTIWLRPDIVDFTKPLKLTTNGRRLPAAKTNVKPDAVVLLEDVRTRADRQRPFWAKIEVP
jgi:hypothetical protein